MSKSTTKIEQILAEAVEISSASERHEFLRRACGDDTTVWQEVNRLLQNHFDAGTFLDRLPSGVAKIDSEITQVVDNSLVPGTQIGPYKLLQQLGEGGFGVVFMAEQLEPVRRRVALKVIKPGMDSRQVIARFEAERQALAVMDHPNIARVLDGGTTESGRPYFVMELLRGTPITQYCDANSLSIHQRLELFTAVCQAIQHAHTKGIIHRDIKPSNVFVVQQDGQAVVKVIDFGIAKAIGQRLTENTFFTDFNQMIGTPLYMSPEQAEHSGVDIDTRSDIYSLGVLLYELLTGSTPVSKEQLKRAAFDEIRRIICEDEPPKPSARISSAESAATIAAQRHTEPARLTRLVRGELDWIVMKALEKDRSRRYETANGFALDVQRYLYDEPVQACPPSAGYRLQKFARRNRGMVAVAAAGLLVLVAAAVASSLAARRFHALAVRNANLANEKEAALQSTIKAESKAEASRVREQGLRKEAERQATIAQRQRDRASASAARARRAVDEYLSRVTDEELLSVPGLQPLRQQLLAAALRFYGEFTREQSDELTLQVEVALAHHRLGRIHQELGNINASAAANKEAIRMLEAQREAGIATGDTLAILAQAYLAAGQHDDSVALCRQLLQDDPDATAVRRTLADTYNALAVNATAVKNYAVALQHHQQAFALREQLVQQHPDDAGYNAELGSTLNNIGVLLNSPAQAIERLRMYQQAVEYNEKACRLAPHSILWGRWLATSNRNIGLTERGRGNGAAALAAFERQATTWRRLVFQNPAVTYLRGGFYKALLELAEQQEQMGLTPEANRARRDAREVLAQLPKKQPTEIFELATIYAALATPPERANEAEQEDAEAADERERHAMLALQMLKQAVDAGWADALTLRNHRTLDSLREREEFQALVGVVDALAAARQVSTGKSPRDADALAGQQKVAEQLGKFANESGSAAHRRLKANVLHSIGVIQSELKQFEEAEKSLKDALAIHQQLRDNDGLQAQLDPLAIQYSLGKLYWDNERPSDAHRLWQETLSAIEVLSSANANNAQLLASCGEMERNICDHYGQVGLWTLASEHAVRNARYRRSTEILWDTRFTALLANSPENYRRYCRAVFDKMQPLADSKVAWELAHLAWIVGQADDAGLKLDEPVRYALKARELEPGAPWFAHVAALIQYRAGRHADAAATLDREKPSVSLGGSATRYLCALAHLHGDEKVARKHFDEAERIYRDALVRTVTSETLTLPVELQWGNSKSWWELVHTQTLRAEAIRAFRGAETVADDPFQHLVQARGYWLIGETELAKQEHAAAFNAADDKLIVGILSARLYEACGQKIEAAAEWKYVLAHAPGAGPEWIAQHPYFAKLLPAVSTAAISTPAPTQPPLAVVPFSAKEAVDLQQAWADHLGMPVAIENSLGMKFRLIPPGLFHMGMSAEQLTKLSPTIPGAVDSASAKRAMEEEHDVSVFLTQPYYLAEWEVTVGQFRKFVDETGYQTDGEKSGLGGYALYQGKWQRHVSHLWKSPAEGWPLADDQPVVHISWNDAKAFSEWLYDKEWVRYAIPTEAQWEFACRAGSTAIYGGGDEPVALESVAWTKESGVTFAQPVGSKLPNAFGLYDMLGNAFEWTFDNYAAGNKGPRPLVNPWQLSTHNGKVIRGLPWYQPAANSRVTKRNYRADADPHDCGQGFRLAIVGHFTQGLPAPLRAQNEHATGQCDEKQVALRRAGEQAAAKREQMQAAATCCARGWVLITKQQYDEAELEFRAALKHVPDSADANFGLGKSLTLQGQFAAAEPALREAVRLQPKASVPRDVLGWSLLYQQKFSEAENEFRELMRVSPKYALGPYGLGKALLEQNRLDEAEEQLRTAVRLDPQLPRTHEMLGSVLRANKKLAEAEAAFCEATRLMPELASAQRGLGLVLHEQKRFAEAIGPLQQAIHLNPNDDLAHNTLGWGLLNQRRFAEAAASLRVRTRALPTDAGAHYALGKALLELKEFTEAEQSLREALRLDPTRTATHGTLGWVYIEQGNPAEAEAAFREQIRLSPKLVSGYFGLGKALLQQKKFVLAEEALQEAVRLDPKHADACDLLGWALLEQQKPAEAEAAFRRLVQLAPHQVGAHFALGRSLLAQKKFADADAALSEALRLAPLHQPSLELRKQVSAARGTSKVTTSTQPNDSKSSVQPQNARVEPPSQN